MSITLASVSCFARSGMRLLLSGARVAADAGSIYEPIPTLTYHWDPNHAPSGGLKRHASSRTHGQSFDLAPHPADPLSIVAPGSEATNGVDLKGESIRADPEQRRVEGQEIYVYYGNGG